MSDSIPNAFADIPVRNPQYLTMREPNELVEIHTGVFHIKLSNSTYKCDGRIYYKWFPYCRIAFEGNILESANLFFLAVDANDIELHIGDICIGKGTILATRSNSSYISGTSDKITMGDSSIPVNDIYFPVINLREYHGTSIREVNQNGAYKGRLSFEDHEFIVSLDKPPSSQKITASLIANGGFIDTYMGRISKKKGAMTSDSVSTVFKCLNRLLFFLNGFRSGTPFLLGVHNEKVVWREYKSITADSYQFVPSWSNVLFLGNLSTIWSKMRELWNNADSRDVLNTSIYWYNQVNYNSAGLEGSIILAQTALELLYNWVIVEKRKMVIGSDALNLNASNKIRLLLSIMNISPELPMQFKELKKLSVIDAPEAFVFIRNALVHGNEEKRKKLLEISVNALLEASHLATWYIELSILNILGYSGKYNNRASGFLSHTQGQLVPWINDPQNLQENKLLV
ncbi:hypothetical protein [Chitinophaga defluvii]|uniref:YopA central domain-containing protein n=1 Tax=Chitinophaga defluvii TaxID=3163343 RepID=A0ABV2T1G5_9BACT